MPTQPPINYQQMPKVPSSPNLPSSIGPKRSGILVIIMIIILFIIGAGVAYYFFVYSPEQDERELVNTELNNTINNINSINDNSNTLSTNSLDSASVSNTSLINAPVIINTNIVNNSNSNNNINSPINSSTDSTRSEQYCKLNAAVDGDCDGLNFLLEEVYGTVEGKADTDGDGFDDGTEILSCYNPLGEGRLDIDDFKSFCFSSFSGDAREPIEALYGVDDAIVRSMCKLWEPFGQQIIDGHIDGSNIDDIINNFPESNLYNKKCPELVSLVGEGEEEDGFICFLMQISIENFCHE